MKVSKTVIVLYKLSCALLLITCATASISAWAQLKPGIVVEKVAKNSEAETAGLQEGDVLLSWSREDAEGKITSPFDLSLIEIEQAPRGTVTLAGFRGPEKRVWTLGQDDWGIRTRPDLLQSLLSVYLEGEELAKAGKLDQAIQRWRAAALQAKESPASSSWLESWFLFHSSETLAGGKQWKEADDAYQESIQQAAGNQPALVAELFRAWANSYKQRRDWANATKYYERSLAKNHETAAESLTIAALLNDIGDTAFQHSDLVKAEEYCRQALTIREKLAPKSLAVAASLKSLALAIWQHGDPVQGEEYLGEALAITQRLAPNSPIMALILLNLGNVESDNGGLAKAEDYDLRSLAIREKLAPGSLDVASCLNNLGTIAWQAGDLTKAEKYLHQSLGIRERLAPGSIWIAGSFNSLGNVALDRGDLLKAEEYYVQALAIKQKLSPGSLSFAGTVGNLGIVAKERGDWAKAEEYFAQTLAIHQKIAPDALNTAVALTFLGEVAHHHGQLDKAEEYISQALKTEEKVAPNSRDIVDAFNRLGDVARDRADLDKAETCYRKALSIIEKLGPGSSNHAESLAALAGIERRKQQLDTAEELFEQALNALESQTAHLGGSEEIRSSFRAKHASYYKDYIDLLLAQKQPERAFRILERLRARIMLEMLATVRVDIRKGVDPALVEKERSLQELLRAKSNRRTQLLGDKYTEDQLTAFDKETNELLAQYKYVEEQIRASSPAYAALTQPQPLGAKEIQQQLLDADTLLLEYSLGEERSYLFAVTPSSLNAYELPKRSDIEGMARRIYELLIGRRNVINGESTLQRKARCAKAEKEYSQAVAELSRMVLGPVAAQLQNKRLLIVSDGALQYIPFAVLPAPSTSGSKTPAPLVAEHEIVNLPSASVLAVLRREEINRKPAGKAVAVLADPVFATRDDRVQLASLKNQTVQGSVSQEPSSNPSVFQAAEPDMSSDDGPSDLDRSAREIGVSGDGMFPRLPFTRREADAIYSTTGRKDALEALDFEASKATALSSQLKDYRIVHFATHGLLNNDHPELSGLVFSLVDKQGQSQDGFLRLLDIYNMELNADLVVLSACQTALGKEIGEEGLVGLTRGFMYAGAPRVVASLWKVDDEATAALMKKFYEGMLREHETPAQALRSAQQWMRTQKSWQSPYYWAGFQLQGEWK